MKRLIASIVIAANLLPCAAKAPEKHLSDYVSTLVGTQSDVSFSTGNTYPATALPWGMNAWTPVTAEQEGDGWAYQYQKRRIFGFKQTHQPSPWINDYGAFSIMPFTGEVDGKPVSWFSHKSETARPYYYGVYLADYDVHVEITPTERAAVIRITFPESDRSGIVVNPYHGGAVSFDGEWATGYCTNNHGGVPEGFRNWFVIKSDTPISGPFATKRGQVVTLYIASSFISEKQALRNLDEVLGRSFEEVKAAAQERWDSILGRIKVSGGTEDQLRTFYSCLYRSTLFPRKFYELDQSGNPIHYSPYDGKVHSGYLYTDTGFWDSFRALFPLLNLVYPDVNAEIQAGLANIARENNFLPEWASPGHRDCMVGNNSASVVADAAVHGLISREDLEVLYKALVYGTEHVHPNVGSTGRKGHEYYNKLGYIPYDVGINESVARTLEYAYDDWCIAKIAKLLDRPQEEIDLYEKRSGNWRNVFDKETRLMRGRNLDGSFQEPFSPFKWGDAFTEGNAWHYTWSVFHDIPGLVEAMGGEDSFEQMLDSVFRVPPVYDDSYYGYRIHEITEMQVADMGNYAHGNQPSQHMLYLYDWTSHPEKGVQRIREVMDRLYSAAPDGYCGDEDNGQTSAWYIFSALGYYPVCPGSGEYAKGEPLFKKVKITPVKGTPVTTSGNPLFEGWYADPEVAILDGEYWIFPTYSDIWTADGSEPVYPTERTEAFNQLYNIQTFLDAFSSKDLVHWTKHPRVISNEEITWIKYAFWAPAVFPHNGKYFLLFSGNDIQNNNQYGGIGIAVADHPGGPYKDYLGHPLVDKIINGAQPIDQFVFKDDDGSIYMYYGGWLHCNMVKLSDNLREIVPFDDGTTFKEITPYGYVEGPFMFKRNGKYYFMWSEGGWEGPEYRVAYAIADSPFGPFERRATILEMDPEVATGAGHHSVLQIPGKDEYYIVYHRHPLGDTKGAHRVTCIDKMEFAPDGTILPVKITFSGVEARPLK